MKDDRVYLLPARDAVRQLELYAQEGQENFLSDRKTQEAAIRNFEVLGEAVKNLSSEVKARHPEVSWKQIAGMRDKLIHEYFGVNLPLIWDVLEQQIPSLHTSINAILSELS